MTTRAKKEPLCFSRSEINTGNVDQVSYKTRAPRPIPATAAQPMAFAPPVGAAALEVTRAGLVLAALVVEVRRELGTVKVPVGVTDSVAGPPVEPTEVVVGAAVVVAVLVVLLEEWLAELVLVAEAEEDLEVEVAEVEATDEEEEVFFHSGLETPNWVVYWFWPLASTMSWIP